MTDPETAAAAEVVTLRAALSGLVTCHGWSVRPGTKHGTECGYLADAGHPLSAALFWQSEVERLTARCAELDIDTRRVAS